MSDTEKLDLLAEPINKALVPASESVGSTLKDLWDLTFGGFGVYVEKKRLTRAKNLQEFRESLYGNVAQIPEERLQEPSLAIIGPAMESSKYFFEEPELREMFANLIAASFDSAHNCDIHPSFTSIIQQLSPLDAQNFALIKGNLPVAQYLLRSKDKAFKTLVTNVFLSNPHNQDVLIQSQSISSLERLGLVLTDYTSYIAIDSQYEVFSESLLYKAIISEFERDDCKIEIQNGVVELTPLGRAFKKVCLR